MEISSEKKRGEEKSDEDRSREEGKLTFRGRTGNKNKTICELQFSARLNKSLFNLFRNDKSILKHYQSVFPFFHSVYFKKFCR